jgi:hypothetical protein
MKRYQLNSPLHQLLAGFDSGLITKPNHQRQYVWKKDTKRDALIQTILAGGYLPPILIRGKDMPDGTQRLTIEDGLQRLTTMSLFLTGKIALGSVKAHTRNGEKVPAVRGVKFDALTDEDKEKIRSYVVHIEYYNNATDAEALKTFHDVNRGSDTLKLGEVLQSQLHNAPLAQMAIHLLLDPESELFQRSIPFWGKTRSFTSKRGKDLTIASATLAGIAYGSAYFNQKEEHLFPAVSRGDFKERRIVKNLTRLIELWEAVNEAYPIGQKDPKPSYWNYTKFNGFILTGMRESELDWEVQKTHWVRFINECRQNKKLHKDTIGGLAGTHASPAWWTAGWTKVFNRYA